jgi:hypothetical protein
MRMTAIGVLICWLAGLIVSAIIGLMIVGIITIVERFSQ